MCFVTNVYQCQELFSFNFVIQKTPCTHTQQLKFVRSLVLEYKKSWINEGMNNDDRVLLIRTSSYDR